MTEKIWHLKMLHPDIELCRLISHAVEPLLTDTFLSLSVCVKEDPS